MNELRTLFDAGGMVALAASLVFGVRYLASQLQASQERIALAHEQTIALLRDTIQDNTQAMVEIRTLLLTYRNGNLAPGPLADKGDLAGRGIRDPHGARLSDVH